MGFMRKAVLAASLSTSLAAFVLTAPITLAQPVTTHVYHLPAQPLTASLREIARISGTSIGVPAGLVEGKSAPALDGDVTSEDAVAAVLAGSGLHLRRIGTGLVIETDASLGQPAGATEDTGAGASGSDILVTGSRIRGGPVASPTIIIGQSAMREQGATSLGEVMRSLPQSFGGGQNPGVAVNVPSASGTNVGGASTINLRGLGSDATLTLLDGHRLAYNGSRQGIDLSALPFGMVDRVEVVADGASALYGSDAVAGVANVILKHDYQGLEASANLGGATDGGDFQQQYGAVAGHRWATGGVVAAYEYSSNTNIFSNDRSYTAVRPGVVIYPAMHHHAAALTAHQALTDTLTFEVDAVFNKRWSLGGYTLNTAGNWDTSHQDTHSTSRTGAISPSLKLDLANGWRLSLSGVYGTETVTLYNAAFSGSTQIAASSACYCNSGSSAEFTADGRVFELPGGPVKLAVGAGYRHNSLRYFTGQGSASNIDSAQDSTYGYGELSVPLVSPAQGIPGIDQLNLSGAVRYERYPGIASVATPKVGLIYAPVSDVAIKGSWGRSFRAPTLYQQYAAHVMSLYPTTSLGGSGYPSTATVMLVTGGNAALQPERAETWTATLDYKPHQVPGLHLHLSYFSTLYKNRIVTPITYTAQSLSNPLYASLVTYSPSTSAIAAAANNLVLYNNLTGTAYDPSKVVAIVNDTNVNAGRQMIHGIDMLTDYQTQLGRGGRLSVTGDVAYLVSSQQLIPGAAVAALAGTLFNPPHWRGRGSVTWSKGGLTVNATTSVTGGVTDVRYTPQVFVPGMVTQDVTARYDFTQAQGPLHGLALSLTARNLFNSQPTTIKTTSYYETAYDSTNYTPFGRYIGMGVSKSW